MQSYLIDGLLAAEHSLDFSHGFAFRLGHNEDREDCPDEAETSEDPESFANSNRVADHLESRRDDECERPVESSADRADD